MSCPADEDPMVAMVKATRVRMRKQLVLVFFLVLTLCIETSIVVALLAMMPSSARAQTVRPDGSSPGPSLVLERGRSDGAMVVAGRFMLDAERPARYLFAAELPLHYDRLATGIGVGAVGGFSSLREGARADAALLGRYETDTGRATLFVLPKEGKLPFAAGLRLEWKF